MLKTTYIREMHECMIAGSSYYKFYLKWKRKIRYFYVEDFKDGVVVIRPCGGDVIFDFIRVIVGCFNSESNFAEEVFKAFNDGKKATFTGIKFWFNGVPVLVTREKLDVNQILNEWRLGCKARN